MMVYFLEYMITTAFTIASTKHIIKALSAADSDQSFTLVNAYVIFNLCYQVGVFISRSSLWCCRIKHVWAITLV